MYSDEDLLTLYSDAEFYDAEFANRNFELDFYHSKCKDYHRILEVACGTGRLTIPLAKQGHVIEGKDVSPAMIAKAQSNAVAQNVNVSFSVEDARHTQGHYDLIFMATNAFQHLIDYRDALQALRSLRASLKNSGRLIIDVQIPDCKRLSRPANESRPYKTFQYQGLPVQAYLESYYEPWTQLYCFSIRYFRDGSLYKQKEVAMRMYFPQEIQALFYAAGLSVDSVWGDYHENELSSSSDKQIYVLKSAQD
ncbi:bifunctional 2-polyprenyl-6-hydroxyphenol methylase/3-demethylubiquinol 3-O-methyltransferase UbiG [Pleionea sp. CnH1-48]|uniref:class I SAM-dependent methyltransferase n=1 Tax=Pleionea sp. CnH1-48 TaxID=2954494 RepID=UPI0020979D5C|nr:class I SAM-dependent methyltransferase [Pleionea sp. CnH1-48]MCO7223406.1 class I SAM-dependent methyltransferase [Pleionea sp. CnH1-48]